MEGFYSKKKRIGDLLVAAGVITEEQLIQALDIQKGTNNKLGTVLIEKGFTTEDQIANALTRQLGLEQVSLKAVKIPNEIISMVRDSALLKRLVCMPYEFDPIDPMSLHVAMADPMDIYATDDLQAITGMAIQPAVATAEDIMACIDRYYGSAEAAAVAEQYTRERAQEDDTQTTVEDNADVENAPIVLLVKKLIIYLV